MLACPYLGSSDTGKLYEYYKKLYIGKEFTVNRATGYMTGALKILMLLLPKSLILDQLKTHIRLLRQ